MPKENKSVEIISTTIKSLSSMSLKSRLDAKAVLEKKYRDVRITDIKNVDDLRRLLARRPSLAFMGMKFAVDDSAPESNSLWLSEYLSRAGIPFTGSGKIASFLEHNKMLAKQRVSDHGIKTAQAKLLPRASSFKESDIALTYPIFIKPADGGGGSGINENSVAHNFSQLKAQVEWLHNHCQADALLEVYLPGREFSVGVLKKRFTDDYHLLPLEIVAPESRSGWRFLSSHIKSQDTEKTLEVTDPVIRHKINKLAIDAFRALGAKDYGRIDIRLDSAGEPYFLEANLLPSLLKDYGNLPKAALLNIGLTHEDLILKIADLGLARSDANSDSATRQDARAILPTPSIVG